MVLAFLLIVLFFCSKFDYVLLQIISSYRSDPYDSIRLRLGGDLVQVIFLPFHLRDKDSIHYAVKYSIVGISLIGRDWVTKNYDFKDFNDDGAAYIARITEEAVVGKLIYISHLNAAEKPQVGYLFYLLIFI